VGVASWYGPGFDGHRTANGEIYNQEDMTAASPNLPLGAHVMVTNLDNGRSVEVRINDRGPFVPGRHIDLSHRAAEVLGIVDPGTAHVRIDVLDRAFAGLTQPFSDTYSVQVGAFVDSSNAYAMRDRLAAVYPDVRIDELDAGAMRYYRVRMGRFPNREAAQARAGESAGLGLSVIIVRQ
jgi:rare lipoprotein A